MNTFPPREGEGRTPHQWSSKRVAFIVAGVVVFLAVFVGMYAHQPEDQATWFSGIATASAVFVALWVALRDGRNQARSERVRRAEQADREASIARTVTSIVGVEHHDFFGSTDGAVPGEETVIMVTVTNHGSEPILALTVEEVDATGPDTAGRLTVHPLPRSHAIPTVTVDFFNSVQNITKVIHVLAPGSSICFAGIYEGATDRQLPGSAITDADVPGMSATVHFTDGRGLAWDRKGVEPPMQVVKRSPRRLQSEINPEMPEYLSEKEPISGE